MSSPIGLFLHAIRLAGTLVLIWSAFACGMFDEVGYERSHNLDELRDSVRVSDIRRPKGDEVHVKLTVKGPKLASLRVENVSGEDVYLPYLPGIDEEHRAAYVILGLEKRNPETGIFESVEESHFGPGSNPLAPGGWFIYDFRVIDSGQFRVNLRYLIDKDWSDRSNMAPFLEREEMLLYLEEFDSVVDKLVGTVTSESVQL